MDISQKNIVMDTNPKLRVNSTDFDINNITNNEKEVIDFMVSYIDACYYDLCEKYQISPGIAIAAPQAGLNKKVIYLHFDNDDKEYQYLLANPEIVKKSETIAYLSYGEGCLSVQGHIEGYVTRYADITVKAYDLNRHKNIEIKAKGLLSICLQHEIDHLYGKLYYDHINKNDPFHAEPNWIKIS